MKLFSLLVFSVTADLIGINTLGNSLHAHVDKRVHARKNDFQLRYLKELIKNKAISLGKDTKISKRWKRLAAYHLKQ